MTLGFELRASLVLGRHSHSSKRSILNLMNFNWDRKIARKNEISL
jgi:hypothetical protein